MNADKGTIQINCAQIAESNSKANIPTNGIGRKKQKYGLGCVCNLNFPPLRSGGGTGFP